jgi:hypothetical protein
VNESNPNNKKLQSITSEEFFYFFLRMRKGEVKRIVGLLQARYPDESPEQQSKRLIASKTRLAVLGGSLLSVPWLFPGVGSTLKLAGIVGATSMLTRMNLYLINEIALVFGEDLDDSARISDMMAVVGATSISTAAPGYLGQMFGLNAWAQLPTGAVSSAAMTQLIGRAAISHFKRRSMGQEHADEGTTVTAVAAPAR